MTRFSLTGVAMDGTEEAGPSRRPRTKRARFEPFQSFSRDQLLLDHTPIDDDEQSEDSEHEEDEEEDDDDEDEDLDVDVESLPNGTVPIESNAPGSTGSISVTLADSDVLDCPVCCEALKIPVFQCDSGHVACSSCCTKVANKCPFCCWSIGYIRCRAMEKIIESIKISCRNLPYGCKEKVNYNKQDNHEEKCLYTPCACPLEACGFMGSFQQLSRHLNSKHSTCVKKFRYNSLFPISVEKNDKFMVFQEESEGSLFILHNTIERLGNVVTVNCIGPNSARRGFSYDLIAKTEGSSLRLQSIVECVSGQVKNPSTGFLIVPTGFFSARQLKIDLCIRTT